MTDQPSAPPEPPAIEFAGITKDFEVGLGRLRLRALEDVSFTVRPGEVVALLGANGSGKTTTLKLVLGLITATRGVCRIFGGSARAVATRQAIGYLPDRPSFSRHLTARETLLLHGRLAGLTGACLSVRVDDRLRQFGLGSAADRRVGGFSMGMLQRLGLAQALVHDPRLLILDEPTTGLDPLGVHQFLEHLDQLRTGGRTVILTSHLLSQVAAACDRVLVLHRGRLVPAAADAIVAPGWRVESLAPDDVPALRAWLERRGACLRAGDRGRDEANRFAELLAEERRG